MEEVSMNNVLLKKLVGEFVGSWITAFLGLMCLAVSITTGAYGLGGASVIFAMAIAFAVYLCAAVGGCHINPAVTLSLSLFAGFPKKDVIPYWIAQILGWFAGAIFLYYICSGMIVSFETAHGIVRGTAASAKTSMIFNCYAPHPFFAEAGKWGPDVMPTFKAIVSEMFGTMFLVVMLYAFLDAKNGLKPSLSLFGLMVGAVVGYVISVVSPATMSGINPARDLGPRLATWLLGWGNVAFPGLPSGQGGPWYIWTIGPLLGGILGGALWKYVLVPCIPSAAADAATAE
jgi:glycerol uptake facilitator protein